MNNFVNPLARKRKPGYPEAVDRVKVTVRSILDLADDIVVSVTELACREPGCPDVETVIAILAPGRKAVTVRLHTTIPEIVEGDLASALLALTQDKSLL
jgi:hypothetical protein